MLAAGSFPGDELFLSNIGSDYEKSENLIHLFDLILWMDYLLDHLVHNNSDSLEVE